MMNTSGDSYRHTRSSVAPGEVAVVVLAWLHLVVYLAVTLFTLLSLRPFSRPIGANFGPMIGQLGFLVLGLPWTLGGIGSLRLAVFCATANLGITLVSVTVLYFRSRPRH